MNKNSANSVGTTDQKCFQAEERADLLSDQSPGLDVEAVSFPPQRLKIKGAAKKVLLVRRRRLGTSGGNHPRATTSLFFSFPGSTYAARLSDNAQVGFCSAAQKFTLYFSVIALRICEVRSSI